MLEAAEIRREAAREGWRPEPFEKVTRLLDLLRGLRAHPYLRPRLALKGGTALNLFVLDAPRLSIDIDLNVVGAATRDEMLAERPRLEQALVAVCGRMGLQVRRVASELAGGKLAALFDRATPRDVFDAVRLLEADVLDEQRLRVAFVVCGAASRRDWRSLRLDEVTADPDEIERTLLPMLRADLVPAREGVEEWTAALVARCRRLLDAVVSLTAREREFLARLNEAGEIVPKLLTSDSCLCDVIARHPALLWKADNVRRHVGSADREGGGAADSRPGGLDRSRPTEA